MKAAKIYDIYTPNGKADHSTSMTHRSPLDILYQSIRQGE